MNNPAPDHKDKWLKYKFMQGSARLAPFLPETRFLTKTSFVLLLDKYRCVIAKPTGGSRGRGVLQVTALKNGSYEIHIENRITRVHGKDRTYSQIKKSAGPYRYIVQRRIPRALVQGRPFDIRVIVQRKSNSAVWVVTGKVAKVAGSGYIVSNIERSGGTLLPLEQACPTSTIKPEQLIILQANIDRVAVMAAKRLSLLYPGHRIYGLDIGVESTGRVWIIEANLSPSRSHFQMLEDKTMLNRIEEYKE
jgi:glutathione synthase/RimK-type ligase-like ATP-grasp enzyme